MAGHVLELRGCTPEPLGNYLKGLGVFRLIAEQADPQTRAWWKGGVLWLHTKWSLEEVLSFFLTGIGQERSPIYGPTPIFAPWGGRPGFYDVKGNEGAKKRLEKLERPCDATGRFAAAKAALEVTRHVLKARKWDRLDKKEREKVKAEIVDACRANWPIHAIEWFDACLSVEDDPRFGFLYGTGGNEGSADITNNFWELIEETIGLPEAKHDSRESLVGSLVAGPRAGGVSRTAGQHFPLAAGCSNCGQDFEGSSSANPWDFILMMEGAVLFAGATTKRLSQFGKGKAAFPFMVDHVAIEGSSTSIKDEAKQDGKVIRCRAEFWMPIWSQPTTLQGIRSVLSEGRLQRHSGERTEHTLHAMEAIRNLGVSRGIDTFHRVALFERRGKGYYLAASLGFHPTSEASVSCSDRLSELEEFRQQVYRNLREGPGVPDRILRARHRLHSSLAGLLEQEENNPVSSSNVLTEVLSSVAALEREVALLSDRARMLRPCPPLTAGWLKSDADSVEYRLARAVAGITAWGESSAHLRPGAAVEAIRANLLPVVRRGNSWVWDETARSAVFSAGSSLSTNLAGILRRRLIEAQRGAGEGLPLWSPSGAAFADLLSLWHGEVDEPRLTDLIHALALIGAGRWDWARIDERQWADETPDLQTSAVWFDGDKPRISLDLPKWLSEGELRCASALPRVYHLLKLCFVGGRLPRRPVEDRTVARSGSEPYPPGCRDVLSLLEAGRLPEAVQVASRRLRAKGYPVVLRDADMMSLRMDLNQCRRLAGILLIPVRQPGLLAALAVRP